MYVCVLVCVCERVNSLIERVQGRGGRFIGKMEGGRRE